MFSKDYIMRQISMMVQLVSLMLFGKKEPIYEEQNVESPSPGDQLHAELMKLLEVHKYGEAENLLFDMLDSEIGNIMEVAMDFYYRLSLLTDDDLIEGGFSREEIDQGLKDLLKHQGIDVPVIEE